MSALWHWQDDALWQSCNPECRVRAEGWQRDPAPHFSVLKQLAAQQPLTSIAHDSALLQQCRSEAANLRRMAEQLVVIGTGGASLGAQALCALAEDPSRVRFLENCDPVTLDAFFKFAPEKTVWCIISKSGETVETLAATLALIGHADAALSRERVRVITASPDSTLGRLAAAQGWKMLQHPPTLGGRFSVFSMVGLLPAAFAGLPVDAIAQSADACLQHFLQQKDVQLLEHAAWFAANAATKPMHLLMGYADRLRAATQWYKQLWAESLGKDGIGATPVTAIGAIDQHSQLQLYLDGPRDKLVTLWLPDVRGEGVALPKQTVAGAEFLQGHRMGDVMQATAEATATTMIKAGVPLRVMRGKLTPQSLASWMARQMLETLLVAHLLGVDPYSQPAVEAGKKLTRAALAGELA
jgi:glucose-6-phosphate isomerase